MAKKTTTAAMLDIEKIKSLREANGFTQEQAAEKAGLSSRQRWHQLESGTQDNITLSTINAMAAALGVNAKELLK